VDGFDAVAWFPLCAGLTAAGLAASWLAWRRRGAAAGLRGVAWSLLPLAAYLTGVVGLGWRVGSAVGRWAAGFVFSPTVWAGLVVTATSAALFAVSGRLRRRARGRQQDRVAAAGRAAAVTGGGRKSVEPPAAGAKSGPAGDDDLAEIEEILRRRGIT
jgi:hypothetical protein